MLVKEQIRYLVTSPFVLGLGINLCKALGVVWVIYSGIRIVVSRGHDGSEHTWEYVAVVNVLYNCSDFFR